MLSFLSFAKILLRQSCFLSSLTWSVSLQAVEALLQGLCYPSKQARNKIKAIFFYYLFSLRCIQPHACSLFATPGVIAAVKESLKGNRTVL